LLTLLDSLINNKGLDDDLFDEFIAKFQDEYKNCKDMLSKKFSGFLESNDFLHDSEILDISVYNKFASHKYLSDISMQIKTARHKKIHTIKYKQVSKFTIEKYKESSNRWTWGYGYIRKHEDSHIEQCFTCFPCLLIKIHCKRIVLI